MHLNLIFEAIKVGQRVKVKGEPQTDGPITATEVSYKSPKNQTEIEGKVQFVDPGSRKIRILNRTYTLPEDVAVKNLQRATAGLEDIREGMRVKMTGNYSASSGFTALRIKMIESIGIEPQEIQGFVDDLDAVDQRLHVSGFTIMLDDHTEVKGF